jgi:hypothetical protein
MAAMPDIFDFDAHIRGVVEGYQGDGTALGDALGALVLGRLVGWRTLRVIYSNKSYTKYQKILGIQFKDVLRERDIYAEKSLGLRILDEVGGFWDFCRSSAGPLELHRQRRVLN